MFGMLGVFKIFVCAHRPWPPGYLGATMIGKVIECKRVD
jgi:hypothetical protein